MPSKSSLSPSNASSLFLSRLARVAATAGGSDRLFMIVQYTLTLVLPSLQPNGMGTSLEKTSKPVQSAVRLYLSLKRLRDMCSDYRIFARLVGYPAIHTWGISVYNKADAASASVPRWIEDAQVLVNLGYQPMENIAYLASHNIIPLSKSTENQLWFWSCRCWAAHVFLDLYRLHLTRQAYLTSATVREKSLTEKQKISFDWAREVIINLAYAPLTLHWSLPSGLPGLSERGVGFFGTIAAIGQISKVWEAAK